MPCPWGGPMPTHTSAEALQHSRVGQALSPVGSVFLSPEFWFAQICLYPPRVESLFPPVLWGSCNQIPLACKIRFPGDSQFLTRSRAGETDVGPTTFTTVKELWYYCSPAFGCQPSRYRIWFYCDYAPPTYCFSSASPLSLDVGIFFCGGF